MKLSEAEINRISHGKPEDITAFIISLLQTIENLETRVKELERQLNQSSRNSSKPPSSDGLRKPSNLRTSGGKKGAPKGHKGHTLFMLEQPDEVVWHEISECKHCSTSLDFVVSHGYERRQVFDLPAPRMVVTEHRANKVCCPLCQTAQQAEFPDGVNAPVQYGAGVGAWTAYLSVYQLLPLERIGQLFEDLTGYRPSEASLLTYLEKMTQALSPLEPTIREELLASPVLHADETAVRVNGKKHWLHTVSNADWTLLSVHTGRGGPGMDAMNVLPCYKGILVHDCFGTYFKEKYAFEHALCNAHLIRECQGIAEYDHHEWPSRMKELLQSSWKLARIAREKQQALCPDTLRDIEQRYDAILREGETEWQKDIVREKTGPRGRKVKSRAANLAERFRLHKSDILRFLRDARVPFDNNQAERDIRMAKVKEKISGSFRTTRGADMFSSIRSFISTFLKQNLPIIASLKQAYLGQFCFQSSNVPK